MKNKISPINDAIINNFISHSEKEVQRAKKQQKWAELEQLYLLEKNLLKDILPMKNVENEWQELQNSSRFKMYKKTEKEYEEKERKARKKYSEAFDNRNENWWRHEIDEIISQTNRLNISPEISMYKRLKGFLGLVSYMKSNQSLNSNDVNRAEKELFIYRNIEPENNEAFFLTAVLMARKGDSQLVFAHLNKAMELGFKDRERLERTIEFEGLKKTEEYEKMLKKLD